MEIQACKKQDRQNEIVERFAVELLVRYPACIVKANHDKAHAPNSIYAKGREYVPHVARFDGETKHIYEVRTAKSLGNLQCLKRLTAIDTYAREHRDIVMHLVVPPAGEERARGLVQELGLDLLLDIAPY